MTSTESEKPKIVRPPWEEIVAELSGCYVACSCGHILQTFEEVREHWQRGHYDYVETQRA